jgi:hypothetical protein
MLERTFHVYLFNIHWDRVGWIELINVQSSWEFWKVCLCKMFLLEIFPDRTCFRICASGCGCLLLRVREILLLVLDANEIFLLDGLSKSEMCAPSRSFIDKRLLNSAPFLSQRAFGCWPKLSSGKWIWFLRCQLQLLQLGLIENRTYLWFNAPKIKYFLWEKTIFSTSLYLFSIVKTLNSYLHPKNNTNTLKITKIISRRLSFNIRFKSRLDMNIQGFSISRIKLW